MSELRIDHSSQEAAIRSFMMLMLGGGNLQPDTYELVSEIGRYYDGDRAYIFESDYERGICANTYEWCADGVEPMKDQLQEVPLDVIIPWEQAFLEKGSFHIEINGDYAQQEPLVYEVLEPQGISALITAPITIDGAIVGFMGVDNPRRHIEQELLISVAAGAIYKELLVTRRKDSEIMRSRVLASLSRAYFCLFYIDINTGLYRELEPAKIPEVDQSIPMTGDARESFSKASRSLVKPEYTQEFLEFTELSTIAERMREKDSMGMHFVSAHAGWCEGIFIVAERDEKGTCTHVLWGVRSIQAEREKDEAYRRQLENYEREQREQLRLVSTLSRDYLNVFLIDPVGDKAQILKLDGYVTDGLQKGSGTEYPYTIVYRKYIRDRVHPDDAEMMIEAIGLERVMKQLSTSEEYTGTYRVLSEGETHYYRFKYVHVDDSDRVIAGFQNVDDMIQAERERNAELQRALEEARRANSARAAFLNRMSHDIRTPLNGIIGIMDINDRHADDRRLVDENRAKARVAADHLLSLVSDVLDLSKLDNENIHLTDEPFDILELTADVLTITQMRATEAGITLEHRDCAQRIQYRYVHGSPLHVRQVMLNLMGNAVKYNRPNGSIHCQVDQVGVVGDVVTYRMTVSDTGIGMSPEFLEHIFEPFSQELSDARSVYKGTGLGMAIVKSILDKMGGTIEVESEKGKGSTFRVEIPFRIASESEIPGLKRERAIDLKGMSVLLVEDNELNMEISHTILADAGAIVTEAHDGKEAFDTFRYNAQGTYDVILMDLMMPVMDGFAATEAIRSSGHADAKRIPIIAVTANAFTEDAQKCLDAGMNGHIAKPLDIPRLLEVLEAHRRK